MIQKLKLYCCTLFYIVFLDSLHFVGVEKNRNDL